MKIILLLFFINSAWANENCISSQVELSPEIADLAHSKCDTQSKLNPCSECIPPLLKNQLQEIPTPTKKELQSSSLKVAIDEYKKVIIRNIVDLAKARVLPNSSSQFKKSLSFCRAKRPSCLDGKKSEIFDDLDKKIGGEIAQLLSKQAINKEGLLSRTDRACFIPEQTILQVSAQTVAHTLDSDILSILEKIPLDKYQSVNDLINDNDDIYERFGDHSAEIINYARNNPYLKDIFSSPQKLISFAKGIPQPRNFENTQRAIYGSNSGEELDEQIADRCHQSFQALEKFVCSKEFEEGSININPQKNFEHMIGKGSVLDTEFPADIFIEQKKQALLFCQQPKKPNYLDLDSKRKEISLSLAEPQSIESPLASYSFTTYKEEFQQLTNQICAELKNETCTDMKNINCRFLANYKKTLVKDSPEYKMANSSNDDVNAVLRGMIGNPSSLDPEVREVLVKEGILPDSKGNIAETGNIPERQPMVMGQASGTTQAKAVATSSAPASKATSTSERPSFERTSANFASPSRAPANAFASSLPPIPDYSDVYEKSDELKRFEEEIQRRLMGLDEPSKPKTVEQAKKVIRDAANSMPSRPHFRPNIENKMAERLLESQRVAPASKSPQDIEQEKIAQAAQDAKWEKELQNRAVSNMAGVRAALEKSGLADPSAKGSASTAQKKDLTKVALNIPEDPKVNLTEVFGKKFNANDPETEVLKVLLSSKNDFLLKINSLDFKIIFDENKQFKVLLQEGDKEEAFRIRPQLELFLKRLSDKNSAGKLSVDLSRN